MQRNKTDRTDVAGILEADRCAQIDPLPIKSPEQQGVQALHRIRERLKAQRTSTINLLRGVLREFGLVIPLGATKVRPAVLAALEDGDNGVPWPCATRWVNCWIAWQACKRTWQRSSSGWKCLPRVIRPASAIRACRVSAC